MKKPGTISVLVILLIFNFAYSISGELSQDLKEKLKTLKEDEYLSGLVMFKDQVSPKDLELCRKLKTQNERHSSIIYKLKEKKEKAQNDILVYLKEKEDQGSVKNYRSFWIVNGILITASKEEIEKIALRPEVEMVSPNYPVSLIAPVSEEVNSSKTGVIDYFQAIGVKDIWKMGYTGKGRLVCGFDTGVEGSHPALFSNWKGGLQGGDGSDWFDPYGSNFPVDANGHGTFSMGIMVGKTTAETLGVAFGSRWIAAGVIDRGRSFEETIADILQAFEWAIDPDGNPATMDDVPDVINNSWGVPLAAKPPCDQTFWSAIDNVEAAGIVVVFAAGNEGPFNSSIRTPADRATSPTNSFSVGAVDAQIYGFPIAPFSSRGPSGCDNITIKPEICAPGVSIRSSYLNGTYKTLSGTSTAAPFVSGAVALLREFNPEATVEEIKNALLLSSTDLGSIGEDNDYGWGLLNLKKALDFLPPPPFPKVWLDSVYMEKDTLVYPDGRKRAKIYLVLKNYGERVDSLSLILKTMDSSVAIIEDSLYFDSIGSKMIELSINSPLVVSYGNNLPLDYPVIFYFKLYDSSRNYVDSLQFSIVLNPSSRYSSGEHNIGNVVFTLSNSGKYGLGDGSITPSGGKGFRFPKSGEDNLFEGAFLVGKSKEQVMDAARDESGKSSENDFVPEGWLTISTPGELSDQDGIGIFSDSGAENRMGVEIVQKSFAFANPPDDDYVILEFTLNNKTSDTLKGIYPGLFFDWDINLFSPKDDLAGRDTVSNISIVYQYDSSSSVYLTIFPLNHPPASYKLINNQLYLYDGFTEEEKYLFLSGDTLITSDTASILYKGDWSIISSCGPFNIPPEESIMVGFAVVAGNSLFDLKENVKSAKIKYYDLRTEVESPEEPLVPTNYSLGQNYPNPFNPSTAIPFQVKSLELGVGRPIRTTLTVYNILGQRVRTLVDENKLPGRYEVIWDGKDEKGKEVSSGIYFYRLEIGGYKKTEKMVLLK
ncbi:MAG: S8 family serine peptidase [Candidatus Zixiibacteriota bacterium]